MIKNQEWTEYGRKAKSIEVNVKDNNNQTIDFFKLVKGNTRDIKRALKKIKEKHNFDLIKESTLKDIENSQEKEKSWIKKDLDW